MPISTPDWVKNAVFYQIFPDRFARSQRSRAQFANLALQDWDAPPTLEGYKGGDLWGVLERLDYLQELGVDAIYFTPVFQSASNHRYHTHDYYRVDPLLGGNEALAALLDAAHQRQMKVVLDGVFNHASRGFFPFHDILENGKQSPWLDWFRIAKWPLAPYDGRKPANYASWYDNRALPQFNHDNPDAREYLMQVGEYWLRQGIDGWRLDVPEEITAPGFWEEFRDRIKRISPEAYLVGEIWHLVPEWLDGTRFDAVMNYPFAGATIAFVGGDRVIRKYVEQQAYEPYPPLDAAGYAEKIRTLLAAYPQEVQLAQLNLLASHDTARLLTLTEGDRESVKLATLLLLTFPGAPCIYYGDEVGLPGGVDPDCRRGFPDESSWDRDLLATHRDLIALRREHAALRTGDYRLRYAEGMVYVFSRSAMPEPLPAFEPAARGLGDSEVTVAVNAGRESAVVAIAETEWRSRPERLLYGTATLEWVDSAVLYLTLPARSGCAIA